MSNASPKTEGDNVEGAIARDTFRECNAFNSLYLKWDFFLRVRALLSSTVPHVYTDSY